MIVQLTMKKEKDLYIDDVESASLQAIKLDQNTSIAKIILKSGNTLEIKNVLAICLMNDFLDENPTVISIV